MNTDADAHNCTRELFFYSPTAEIAASLAAALQEAGYLVPDGATPPGHDIGQYSLLAYRGYPGLGHPDGPAELARIDNEAKQLAQEHGSEYDGGGEWVGDLVDFPTTPTGDR